MTPRQPGYVVTDADFELHAGEATQSATRVTIDASHGSDRLEQRIADYRAGRTERSLDTAHHAVMFVAAGSGRLHLGGEEHALEPDCGVFVAAGETFAVEPDAGRALRIVEVAVPREADPAERRSVVVRYEDQPALSAGIGREFRILVGADAGISEVTQFVGVIPPGRAPMHCHEYDEVAYIVEGEGTMHWADGRADPVRRGSCIHFPRLKMHSLENSGPGPMRVMGVFHPQGSPAARLSEGNI